MPSDSSRRSALVALSLAAVAVAATFPVQAQDALAAIVRSGKVRIAIPTDYPPYGFVGPDLKPRGLDIDMAHHVAAKLGAEAELVPVTSANRIPYLQTGKVDLVISTLGKTPEREQVVDFTPAYSPFFQAVFAPRGMRVKAWSDLDGKTVSVTRGAMADAELGKVISPAVTVRRFDDHVGTVTAFVSGQVQVIATSATEGEVIMRQNPGLQVEYKLLLKDSPNFIGVAKGQAALRARLDEIVREARRSGDIDRLSNQWLGRPAGDLPL